MKKLWVTGAVCLLLALSACTKPPEAGGDPSPSGGGAQTEAPPVPSGDEVTAVATAAGAYEGQLTVEVLDAAFVDYEGESFVAIIANVSWTEEYAEGDPYIKAYYAVCKDETNQLTTPADRQMRARDRAAGSAAFPEGSFDLFEIAYMKDAAETSLEGGFIGYVGAGCNHAVLQLVVTERFGDQVFCEVEITR